MHWKQSKLQYRFMILGSSDLYDGIGDKGVKLDNAASLNSVGVLNSCHAKLTCKIHMLQKKQGMHEIHQGLEPNNSKDMLIMTKQLGFSTACILPTVIEWTIKEITDRKGRATT